jgi:poly-gamma-glutamate system protein
MKFFTRKRIYFPESQDKRLKWLIFVAGIVSILAFLSVKIFTSEHPLPYSNRMITAAQIMEKAISAIRSYCNRTGIKIDETTDPNLTGLIGSEISPIATTLGNLAAKRTTTNPEFAALVVRLLEEAGVSPGDTIAIGSSGSFPALMIAAIAAAQSLNVYPIIIISLGASSYGATNPDFNLLSIYEVLFQKKIFTVQPAAVSLGGDQDVGRDFDPAIKARLIKQIKNSGFPFIYEPNLEKNVAKRMKIFEGNSSKKSRIAAFVNIGGGYANIGTSEQVLKIKPGLSHPRSIPPKAERGVLFGMAARKIPIIHLLYIKGLAMKYGLPWDPIPLPEPMESGSFNIQSNQDIRLWIISGIYFTILIGLIVYGIRFNFHPTEK